MAAAPNSPGLVPPPPGWDDLPSASKAHEVEPSPPKPPRSRPGSKRVCPGDGAGEAAVAVARPPRPVGLAELWAAGEAVAAAMTALLQRLMDDVAASTGSSTASPHPMVDQTEIDVLLAAATAAVARLVSIAATAPIALEWPSRLKLCGCVEAVGRNFQPVSAACKGYCGSARASRDPGRLVRLVASRSVPWFGRARIPPCF